MNRAPTSNLNKEVIQNLHVQNIPICNTVLKVSFYEIIKGYKFEVLNLSNYEIMAANVHLVLILSPCHPTLSSVELMWVD